jgi:hypothetical protein
VCVYGGKRYIKIIAVYLAVIIRKKATLSYLRNMAHFAFAGAEGVDREMDRVRKTAAGRAFALG